MTKSLDPPADQGAGVRPRGTPRRFTGSRVAISVVLIAAAALSFAMWRFYATRFPTGEVVGFVPLGPDDVLVFRESDNQAFSVEMVRVHRLNGPQWRKGVYRLQYRPPEGLTVQGGLISLRAQDVDGHLETHVFSEQGEFLYRRRAFDAPWTSRTPPEGRSFIAEGLVFELYLEPTPRVQLVPLQQVESPSPGHRDESPSLEGKSVDLPAAFATQLEAGVPDRLRASVTGSTLLLSLGEAALQIDGVSGALREVAPTKGLAGGAGTVACTLPSGAPLVTFFLSDGVLLQSDDALLRFDRRGNRLAGARVRGTSLARYPVSASHIQEDRFWLANEADVRAFALTSLRSLHGVAQQPTTALFEPAEDPVRYEDRCRRKRDG